MSPTILVVDDSVTMRLIVQATLVEAGWQVVMAENGQAALEAIKSHSIDLLISDWNMPIMGGLELIQKLRGWPQYEHLPVLVLTTDNDLKSKEAARDCGVCGWLNKPFDPEALLEMAAELLAPYDV